MQKTPWFKIISIVLAIAIPSIGWGAAMYASNAAQEQQIVSLENKVEQHKGKVAHDKASERLTTLETHYEHILNTLTRIDNKVDDALTQDFRGRD